MAQYAMTILKVQVAKCGDFIVASHCYNPVSIQLGKSELQTATGWRADFALVMRSWLSFNATVLAVSH